jgi:DNA helicase HerA-like ATPase
MLVSQARKYGLGLIFATQAPKGLHNQIGERGDTVLRAAERAGVYRRGPGDGPL